MEAPINMPIMFHVKLIFIDIKFVITAKGLNKSKIK